MIVTIVATMNITALLICVIQLIVSRCTMTKVLALDLISLFTIILLGIISLNGDNGQFCLDIGVLLALSAFIGTIAFAKMSIIPVEDKK